MTARRGKANGTPHAQKWLEAPCQHCGGRGVIVNPAWLTARRKLAGLT